MVVPTSETWTTDCMAVLTETQWERLGPLIEPSLSPTDRFAMAQEWRAVATRYEKLARSFMAVLCLAAAMDWLKP